MTPAVAMLVAVVALLVAAAPSQAAFPGNNGKIAFATDRDGDHDIYVMNADGSGQTALTSSTLDDLDPAWSPDGKRIAFTRTRESPAYSAIWVMNSDGTQESPVISSETPGDRFAQPTWSPDGTQIAMQRSNGIALVDTDGTDFHHLTPPNPIPSDFTYTDDEPTWSPDGTTILFSRGFDFETETSLWAIRPDGTQLRQVTTNVIEGEGWTHDNWPDWAPAGPRFAVYRSFSTQEFQPGLVVGTEANPPRFDYLTPNDFGGMPAWAPDGTKIAYEARDIYVVPASGGLGVQITDSPSPIRGVDWQPIPVNSYVRPASANWIHVSLVPASDACTAPNRTHGPPLAFGSCAPPSPGSEALTVGTPDANGAPVKAAAQVVYGVQPGNPSSPVDEADVVLKATVTDVRNAGALSDHVGTLSVRASTRVTDKYNAPTPAGYGAATVTDGALTFDLPCTATTDTTIGSTCVANTSVDAIVAGAVRERQRSVWELGAVEVRDAGGQAFMRQGVFVP